jgi:hypothetical protein
VHANQPRLDIDARECNRAAEVHFAINHVDDCLNNGAWYPLASRRAEGKQKPSVSSDDHRGHLDDPEAFAAYLAPLLNIAWVVHAKRPFAGPEAVLAYLSRYTHRIAIANSRLISSNDNGVTFKWKDYRAKGRTRQKSMTLATGEFMCRFLIHVLPNGFHRIRHYGLFANGHRAQNLSRARQLLDVPEPQQEPADTTDDDAQLRAQPCPCCGGPMVVIEVFERGALPRAPPRRRKRAG